MGPGESAGPAEIMDIAWLGHACFRLRADDTVVVTDPYPASLGLTQDSRSVSVVTISNIHPNHSDWHSMAGDPKVFASPGEFEYSGVNVRGVMTTLQPGTLREHRNVAYTVEIGEINICHLGDITVPLSPKQIDDLSPVDVLLAPVGGGCTLDVDSVFQLLQDLGPKIVIPMHYLLPAVNVPLQGLDVFLRRMGIRDVQPQPRVLITRSNLPTDTKVVVLDPLGQRS
jgi:L-ascorbate metabolism protein UlaG (beta-lactamase superfamily)